MGANSTQKELGYDLVQPHCEVRVLAAAPPCSCPKILQENHNWSLYTDKYFGEGASLALQSVFQGVGDVTDVFLFLSTTSLMESRGQPRTKLAFLSSFLSVSVIGAFPPGHNDVEDAVFFFMLIPKDLSLLRRSSDPTFTIWLLSRWVYCPRELSQ